MTWIAPNNYNLGMITGFYVRHSGWLHFKADSLLA